MNYSREDIQALVEDVVNALDQGGNVGGHDRSAGHSGTNGARQPSTDAPLPGGPAPAGSRIIITALGRNSPGVAAAVTGALATVEANIQDMSQTLLGDFFAMIVVADMAPSRHDFGMIKERLMESGASMGVKIMVQHEDVFRYMHRI